MVPRTLLPPVAGLALGGLALALFGTGSCAAARKPSRPVAKRPAVPTRKPTTGLPDPAMKKAKPIPMPRGPQTPGAAGPVEGGEAVPGHPGKPAEGGFPLDPNDPRARIHPKLKDAKPIPEPAGPGVGGPTPSEPVEQTLRPAAPKATKPAPAPAKRKARRSGKRAR